VSKNKLIISVVFVIISFFIFRHCVKAGVSMIGTVSSSILYPLLRVQHAIIMPIAQWFEHKATIQELENVIQNMRDAHEQLYAENSELKALCLYAQETSELRNFNKRYALHNGHMVQILARHFSATKQFFLVDAGSSQGIKKDMVALYGNNVVGRVAQVYPWYCEVCLVTDADCKIASAVAKSMVGTSPKGGANGIHEGCNDASKTLVRYVSHLETVDIGDTVLSSGEGLVFPKGFALGKVLAADKGELFYEITVQPALDFHTLRYCTLIAKEDI
jgi:rod shape-determining protein MreC